MNKTPGRGPRRGRPDTREAIRSAARARFLAEGYQDVTLRTIAADAGVDVALVSYYFTSKQGLFAAAMALPANPVDVLTKALDGPLADVPEAVLRDLLAVWGAAESGPQLVALARAATSVPELNRLVGEAVSGEIVARLTAALPGADAAARAAAFSTQLAGVVYARYVLRLEPIASMTPDEVVRALLPALKATLGRTAKR